MEAAKEKFRNYWAHKNTGRPLMCVIARRPEVEQYSDGTPVEGNIINLRLDITHLYYPAKNSFQKGRLKRREIFTELLLYTLTT